MKYDIFEYGMFAHYAPKIEKLTLKQIGFLVVVLVTCLLIASHYDYQIINLM